MDSRQRLRHTTRMKLGRGYAAATLWCAPCRQSRIWKTFSRSEWTSISYVTFLLFIVSLKLHVKFITILLLFLNFFLSSMMLGTRWPRTRRFSSYALFFFLFFFTCGFYSWCRAERVQHDERCAVKAVPAAPASSTSRRSPLELEPFLAEWRRAADDFGDLSQDQREAMSAALR